MDKPLDQTLGRYQIVSLIARGGMAEVYKAFQPSLNRYVAIKLLHPHLADEPGFVSRFEREAASVARLRHPNIVQVIDFDCQDERYFMIMEFIEGKTLKADLEDRAENGQPYTPQQAAYVISSVASALDYAHGRGILHRDIKPGNILLTDEGQVVLADFGIAHIVGTTLYTQSASAMGTPAYMSPEQGRGEMGDARSDIYSLGVVLFQMLIGRLPFEADTPFGLIQQHIEASLPPPRQLNPDLPPAVDAVIIKALAKQPEQRYKHAGEMALALLDAVGLAAEQVIGVAAFMRAYETPEKIEVARKPLPICPYRGLFAFREQDAPFFFGREVFTDQLIDAVEVRSLVAVVGPSGSGKSSVVLAGLLPHLRQAAGLRGTQGRAWLLADFRPGADPFYSLATALLPLLETGLSETDHLLETRKLASNLQSGDLPLSDVVGRMLKNSPEYGRLLLAIDQFEEIYTLCTNAETRQRFVEALLKELQLASNLTIVITLRADFLGQALSLRPFADALQDTVLMLGPMTKWELVQAIENPARKQGVTFEAGLVERILDDVGDEPGNLPLLEFALTQLWEEQPAGQLTHAAYETIGRVQGALSRYADRVYANLNQAQRDQARHIFTQMVRPGEGTVDTRRLALREELGEEHWALVQELADARLVITGREAASGHETVEVVHEALIQGWRQLCEWMAMDRLFRSWQERLRAALHQWNASNQDEGALLRGAPLVEAEDWLLERQPELSQMESEYIQESVSVRNRLQREHERRRQWTIIALVGGLIIALALALLANSQRILAQNETYARATAQAEAVLEREKAEEQASLATSRELAAAALNNLSVDPERSVLLALYGLSEAHTLEAENALHQAVPQLHLLRNLKGHAQTVESIAVSPDGSRLASASIDGVVKLWDLASYQELLSFSTHKSFVFGLTFSPDGKLLATAGDDKFAKLWNVDTGEQLLEIDTGTALSAIAFSPDGRRLATAGADARAIIWDATSGEEMLALEGHIEADRAGSLHPGGVIAVVFTPDNERLITGGADGTVRIWDAESGQGLHVISAHTNEVYIALSSDGSRLMTAGYDGLIKVWDVSPGSYPAEPLLIINHDSSARAAIFSADGSMLAAASSDGAARVWDANSGQKLLTLVGHLGLVDDVAFSQDGSYLMTGAEDGLVKLWDLAPGRELLTFPGNLPTFSPDGSYLATELGGSILILDSDSGETISTIPTNHTHAIINLSFSPDSQQLASASWDGTAKVWDISSGKEIATLVGHTNWVWEVSFSPDGKWLATFSDDETVRIWDPVTGEQQLALEGHAGKHQGGAISPDGKTIASASYTDASVMLWDALTGRQLGRLNPGLAISDVAYSPDGRYLAASPSDGSVIFWDITSGEAVLSFILTGHTSFIPRFTFSPDGKYLATSCFDGTTRVWDVERHQNWLTLYGQGMPTTDVSFSPDSSRLASGGFDGLVRIYALQLEDLIDLAVSRVTRTLTEAECQQYLHLEACPAPPEWFDQ